MTEDVKIPEQFTHSVKIEDTAKGIRVSIHVYANDLVTAVNEAIKLYQATKQKTERKHTGCANGNKIMIDCFELRVGFIDFLLTIGVGTLLLYFK
jgi:hypothetical protein